MIFLYRFDVMSLDGVVSSNTPAYRTDPGVLSRAVTVYTLTNSGAPVRAPVADIPFLPPLLDANEEAISHLVYQPEAIQHDQIRLDGERNAGQLKVSLPLEHPLAQLYAFEALGVQVWLTLYQFDSTVAGALPLVIWVGQSISAEFDEHRCTLTLDHLQKVLTRPGLTAKHPRACGHLVYDRSTCGVKDNTLAADGYWKFREDGFVASVSADGMELTVPEAANRPDGWFAEGYLVLGGTYTREGGTDDHLPRAALAERALLPGMKVFGGFRRSIVAHTGAVLRLAVPLPPGDYTLVERTRLSLYAGCDGALTTCRNKFNNVPRFGGFPYIPIKNPFEVGLKNANGD